MRQVAIGAVVAFVLTVIALSVWKPSTGEVTPASPPTQPQLPLVQPSAPLPANVNRMMVEPPAVLPARALSGEGRGRVRPMPTMRDALPTARFVIDAGTP
ncbi:MAG: hypothetical protein DI536_20900 [Archangium gephyra]|uniref:Uncharacterized protein n=1 Tax=Archangium gephyra TaxID=48 RepID=A0A2W5T9U1_9BACT|nr:MAG: hypothetical protein DI536_20900 [Archangium gephyra]